MQELEYQCWLAKTSNLTSRQKSAAMSLLQQEGNLDIYPILENMRPSRQCPHCQSLNSVKRGIVRKLQRYQCKECRKTYNALTGTAFSRLRHREHWLSYAAELIEGSSIRLIAKRCSINKNTAFLWRHRFLHHPSSVHSQDFTGITEADETYFLESFKGQRNLPRPPRKRGGKASKRGLSTEQTPVLITRDRTGATLNAIFSSPSSKANITEALARKLSSDAILCTDTSKSFEAFAREQGICHRMINSKLGIRVLEQVFHIQNVNAYDSGLKRWMIRFKGVATKYLHSYLGWFRLQDRIGELLNPHRCLAEAIVGGAQDTCKVIRYPL